jgi:hypothetical protein
MRYEYNPGDRVQYTGNPSNRFFGKLGTVVGERVSTDSVTQAVSVRFDGYHDINVLYCQSFTKIKQTETDHEIDAALAVLKKYGKVEFKKNKPPFVNKKVHLNNDYTAQVTDKLIIVGCQYIPFTAIDELAEAVASARKYNEEK